MAVLNLLIRDVVPKGETHGYKIIIIGAVFTFLATCGMVARFASLRMRKGSFGVGEGLILISFIFNIFSFGTVAWAVEYAGWGRHVNTLNYYELTRIAKILVIASFVQPTILTTAKISILLLLYKVFATRSYRIFIIAFIVVVMVWYIGLIFATAFICWPFHNNWSIDHPTGCGKKDLAGKIVPIPWIITDFGILILPMPMIRKLQMPKRQKVALAGLFLFGGLTCIVSCVRYAYIYGDAMDFTWVSVPIVMLQLAESNTTILCACLIAGRPAVMYLIPDRLIGRIRQSVSRMRKPSVDKLAPQTTPDPPKPSRFEKIPRNIIHKSSSIRLDFVPRDTAEHHDKTDRTSTTNQEFLQLPDRCYTVNIEGGSRHLDEELILYEYPSISDVSTLRES